MRIIPIVQCSDKDMQTQVENLIIKEYVKHKLARLHAHNVKSERWLLDIIPDSFVNSYPAGKGHSS
jgi:hypothetical protein